MYLLSNMMIFRCHVSVQGKIPKCFLFRVMSPGPRSFSQTSRNRCDRSVKSWRKSPRRQWNFWSWYSSLVKICEAFEIWGHFFRQIRSFSHIPCKWNRCVSKIPGWKMGRWNCLIKRCESQSAMMWARNLVLPQLDERCRNPWSKGDEVLLCHRDWSLFHL